MLLGWFSRHVVCSERLHNTNREGNCHTFLNKWSCNGLLDSSESRLRLLRIPRCFWTIFWSVLIAVTVAYFSGLVTFQGSNYSADLIYRRQVQRLLNGELSFGRDPSQVTWDLAWDHGTVQQVWGLGVPLWRLPFEVVARWLGYQMFPDRFALAAAYSAMILVVLRFHGELVRNCPLNWIFSYCCLLPLIAFPPFLMVCRSRFLVYEEAAAYSYFVAVILLVSAWNQWFKTRVWKSLLIALCAGSQLI